MEKLTFYAAGKEDIPLITEVLSDATQYKLSQGDTSWGEGDWYTHEIQERMTDGNTFYVVKNGDEVVGTVSLSWSDDRNWSGRSGEAGYIHQLAVKRDHRGKDIGGQIIEKMATEVAQLGGEYLRLDCSANNLSLCNYYEQHGFVRVDSSPGSDNEAGGYQPALYERKLALKA